MTQPKTRASTARLKKIRVGLPTDRSGVIGKIHLSDQTALGYMTLSVLCFSITPLVISENAGLSPSFTTRDGGPASAQDTGSFS